MSFVLDASIVLTWCFPDENSPRAQKVAELFRQGRPAIAPSFWPHEVLNALLAGEKRGRISRDLGLIFLADLAALPIRLRASPMLEVFTRTQAISRDHGLTPYDAAYLELAARQGLPLATVDKDLLRACRKSGVEAICE